MTKDEIKQLQDENAFLKGEVERLKDELVRMVSRNLDLSERLEYDVELRRRTEVAREIMEGNIERQRNADLRDDDELIAIIETRLEESLSYQNPNFGLKELAQMVGTSQRRILDLFRRSPIHKSADDYLDYLRLLRSMYYLQTEPSWSIAACAQEAGFLVIRTYNRKFQDALGMTPHEFRQLIEENTPKG